MGVRVSSLAAGAALPGHLEKELSLGVGGQLADDGVCEVQGGGRVQGAGKGQGLREGGWPGPGAEWGDGRGGGQGDQVGWEGEALGRMKGRRVWGVGGGGMVRFCRSNFFSELVPQPPLQGS